MNNVQLGDYNRAVDTTSTETRAGRRIQLKVLWDKQLRGQREREKRCGENGQKSMTTTQRGGELKNQRHCKANKQPVGVGRPEADVVPEVGFEDGYDVERKTGQSSSILFVKMAKVNG